MILKGKLQEDPRAFGFVEKYEHTSYGKNRNLKIVTTLTKDGTLGLPYLYFSGEFVDLYSASDALGEGGLQRYVKAKKPIHSIIDGNCDIVSLRARDTPKGVSYNVSILRPNPKVSTTDVIKTLELPATEAVTGYGIAILEELLNTDCSRYAYLQARKTLV